MDLEIDPDNFSDPSQLQNTLFLDVREADELSVGRIPGSIHIPKSLLERDATRTLPSKDQPIVTYCASGGRSLLGAKILQNLGYSKILSLAGGFSRWTELKLPIEGEGKPNRYLRQISIPEVGEIGQAKLSIARILVVGAGGLGCPASLYLCAAGVGTIGVVDFDKVDETNLQRQILYKESAVGEWKVDSAKRALLGLNSQARIKAHNTRLDAKNVNSILSDYDLAIDASDNFETRYLLNEACVKQKKPYIYGGVFQFEGHLAVFDTLSGGPCYQCLFPEAPSRDFAPNCAEAGVLGVLPGIIGVLQATEALKIVLGLGQMPFGRMVRYDALTGSFQELTISKDFKCQCCGTHCP
jgi:sulfur-carrier protein adenylyltransferase/sulfurtransferase